MKKEKPAIKICKYCKTEIPFDAKVCPQCRKKQGGNGCLVAIGVVVAIGVLGSCFAGGGSSTETTAAPTKAASAVATSETTAEATTVAESVAETTAPEANVPTEYKSALKKADTYSDTMHMSKARLYDQLTSEYGEKFSAEAAQYAIDNVDADWNANALANAQNYNDTMHMSKARLYDQLVSDAGEKFTEEEAQYAVDNVKADWNENALATAKNYQDTMAMSPEAIRSQLTSDAGEKFTADEADYAISHLEQTSSAIVLSEENHMRKNYNKWAALFGGWFGLHKYMAGEIGMGILYTATFGLFCIGWIADTIKAFISPGQSSAHFRLPLNSLPVVTPNGLVLKDGEICHYQGAAHTEKNSTRIAGYTSQHAGGSVRIAKGLSVHTGGTERQAVRETLTEKSNGILYITNKRIIFIAPKNAFDKPISSLTAYVPNQGHISLLFGNQSYDLITADDFRIKDIIEGILNGMPIR